MDTFNMPPVVRVKLVREGGADYETASWPYDAARIIGNFIRDEDREHLVVLMLDTRNHVVAIHTVSIGDINSSSANPREVFKAAILANASSIILGHNHPSGDPTPSPSDVEVTRMLKSAGDLLDIHVLDHIIVAPNYTYRSIRSLGLMPD